MLEVVVRLQSGSGAEIRLPQYAEISYGNRNEITFSWQQPLRNVLYNIMPAIAKNVQVERNRAGTYVAIADPGIEPVQVEWTEYAFVSGNNIPTFMSEKGLLTVGGNTFRQLTEFTTLTLYRVHYVFIRATGEEFELLNFSAF